MNISRRHAIARIGATGTVMLLVPGSALAKLVRTPSAVMGPFYPLARPPEVDADLAMVNGKRAIGQLIEVSGRVFNARGRPVQGASLKLWQANAAGRYAHPNDTSTAPLDPNFQGATIVTTDGLGRYRFTSIKPGPYPDGDGSPRPPHIHFDISSSHSQLITQMLFPGEQLNRTDDVIPSSKRSSLIGRAAGLRADGARRFEWDIVLDGA